MVTRTKESMHNAVQDKVRLSRSAVSESAGAVEHKKAAATAEDVLAHIESELYGLLDQVEAQSLELNAARREASSEAAEPMPWWDLFTIGPFQFTPPFMQPSGVIQSGETAFLATILMLNPVPILPGPISPQAVIEGFAPNAEIKYRTGNLDTYTLGEPGLQITSSLTLCSGCGIGPFYVDVQAITPTNVGVYDMTISARIVGGAPLGAAPFGGLTTVILKLDSEPVLSMFGFPGSTPGFERNPLRFSVYVPG